MKHLHQIAEFQRLYKTEKDTLQDKIEKIAIERELDQKRLEENQRKADYQKKKEMETRIKEQ